MQQIDCSNCNNKCGCYHNHLKFKLESLSQKEQECEKLNKLLDYLDNLLIQAIKEKCSDCQNDLLKQNKELVQMLVEAWNKDVSQEKRILCQNTQQ